MENIVKTIFEDLKQEIKTPMFRRSPFKHLWYRIQWHLRPFFKISGRVPLAVDVELCQYCSFRCVFCQQAENWWNKKKISIGQSLMTEEKMKMIVDQCARIGVYSMKVNFRGEPMINPHLAEYVKYMKDKGIHEVQMNTNANEITKENATAIIESGIDRVIFSCDGISREIYNKLRVGGDFDKFMKNVKLFKRLCNIRETNRLPRPIIRINASIQSTNKEEIPLFREVFKMIADEVRFNTVYNPQGSNKFLNDRNEKRIDKKKGCTQIFQRLIITSDGYALPCCADYKQELSLGKVNVNGRSIEKVYKMVGSIREAHSKHKGRELNGCKNCNLFALSEKTDKGIVWR